MCSRTFFGLFVGYLSLFCYGLVTIGCIVLLADRDVFEKHYNHRTDVVVVQCILIILLIVSFAMTSISGLLIAGILKKRRRYIKPWLVLTAVNILINLIVALIGIFDDAFDIRDAIIVLVHIAIQCLIFYPIYSLYKTFRV